MEWVYTGILADLLRPVIDLNADACVIDETQVRWTKTDLSATIHHSALGAARSRKLRRLKSAEHEQRTKVRHSAEFDESRYTDGSTDWYTALLGEHLTDDDIFLHTLSGPTSTFTTTIPKKDIPSSDHPALNSDTSIDIVVDWTARSIRLFRTPFIMGPTGSGKSTTLYGLIQAIQDAR